MQDTKSPHPHVAPLIVANHTGTEPTPLKVEEVSREVDKKGIERPIREGIDEDLRSVDSDDQKEIINAKDEIKDTNAIAEEVEDDTTSEEEEQRPGTIRSKKGEGWWGLGPPLQTMKRGSARDFVDGAGYPSPGRWPIDQRQLPDDSLANELRSITERGLKMAAAELGDMSLRTTSRGWRRAS